jgi:hypothetical protein
MIMAIGVDKPPYFEIGFDLQKKIFHLRKSLLGCSMASQPRQSCPFNLLEGRRSGSRYLDPSVSMGYNRSGD